MAESNESHTSEELAKAMKTNPVVVRRTMAGLRVQGFVSSEKGHGGGWQLSCDLNKITLLDIYKAVDSPEFFAMTNRNENSVCQIETAVNMVTRQVFTEAKELLLKKFKSVSLANLQGSTKRKTSKTKQ